MRDLAENNVEQARVAYGQFMEFMSQAMNAWSASGVPEAKNFKTLQDRAVGFAKENADRSFALASELAKANDMQQVMTAAEPLRSNSDANIRPSSPAAILADGRCPAKHAVWEFKLLMHAHR